MQACDGKGNLRRVGGDQFRCALVGPSGNPAPSAPRVKDLMTGEYEVEWVGAEAGEFSLSVTLEGAHVAGSPFRPVVEARRRRPRPPREGPKPPVLASAP